MKHNKSEQDFASHESSCFDCNICLHTAHDPIVTLCWPCIFCKSNVTITSLVPLYERGMSFGSKKPDSVSTEIPRRPAPSTLYNPITSEPSLNPSFQHQTMSPTFHNHQYSPRGFTTTESTHLANAVMMSFLYPVIGMFLGMVYTRISGTFTNAIAQPYQSQRMMQREKSLNRLRKQIVSLTMPEEAEAEDMGGDNRDADVENDDRCSDDTSAAQARDGKDIQGIPWDMLSITRQDYRKTRLQSYRNYENIPNSGEATVKEDCINSEKGSSFYMFKKNSRSVKSTILHFQLRDLVWATSNHDVYLLSNYSITHWSSLTSRGNEVLNLAGLVAPSEKHPGSLLEGFSQTQVSTLAVKDGLVVVGGFSGELICKHLDRPGVSFCYRTTCDENAITNAVDIHRNSSGALHFMASSNDGGVRNFDMETYQLLQHFHYPWPVNGSSVSPDGKLVAIVGDDPDGLLVDSNNGDTVGKLNGHLDYSFASAWHPDGVTFATGNQDKTCRVWDLRNLSKSVAVLKGNLGAIHSIRFTSDGQYMAMAESADFVHIYNTNTGYMKKQEIDFFGEVSGISFSPDTESLFIGIWDRTYGSLMEYARAWVLESEL